MDYLAESIFVGNNTLCVPKTVVYLLLPRSCLPPPFLLATGLHQSHPLAVVV
jgi:hypothetical protein